MSNCMDGTLKHIQILKYTQNDYIFSSKRVDKRIEVCYNGFETGGNYAN